jgi:hypothetical protein
MATQKHLREKAEKFAEEDTGYGHQQYSNIFDYCEYLNAQIGYLIAINLGKDPTKCYCDDKFPVRKIETGQEICCECERPTE